MFLPYIIIPYTDTISMVFPILIFYLYIKIKEEKNETKKAFFTILEGILTILGYYIIICNWMYDFIYVIFIYKK